MGQKSPVKAPRGTARYGADAVSAQRRNGPEHSDEVAKAIARIHARVDQTGIGDQAVYKGNRRSAPN